MSSSDKWRGIYKKGKPMIIGHTLIMADDKAVEVEKEIARTEGRDFWICKTELFYFAFDEYPKPLTPLAHVYPAGRVEWRVEK